jgi:mannose PTS system EIIA component
MIGSVIVCHGNLAGELLKAAELIVGRLENTLAVSINSQDSVGTGRAKIAAALDAVDKGEGVLILTDMFGGTSSNLSLSFLGEREVEVVSGVNLPMLIKLPYYRGSGKVREMAEFIRDYGQKHISVASSLLFRKNREANNIS